VGSAHSVSAHLVVILEYLARTISAFLARSARISESLAFPRRSQNAACLPALRLRKSPGIIRGIVTFCEIKIQASARIIISNMSLELTSYRTAEKTACV
jgi:hypothetical protein